MTTFMKQLGSLEIRMPVRKHGIGEKFGELTHIEQVEYMAQNIQIEKNTYDSWFYKGKIPKASNLLSISKHFDVSIDYLLGNAERKESYGTQYIMEQTGLSAESIEKLCSFNTYNQGKIRLSIIDRLLQDIRFSYQLTDTINDYYGRYDLYKNSLETLKNETRELSSLSNGDIVKEFELINSGSFNPSINKSTVEQYNNAAEAIHFKIQKLFDDVLLKLIEYYYDKNNKAPGH